MSMEITQIVIKYQTGRSNSSLYSSPVSSIFTGKSNMNIYILTWKYNSGSIPLMRTNNTLYLVDKQREEVLDLNNFFN